MRHYFKEGELFTWVRDAGRGEKELIINLKMLREIHLASLKQGLVAQDIRTGKMYFAKVIFYDELDQVYVEKESKAQLFSPFIIRIYGGMLDSDNHRFITLMEYIPWPDLSDLVRKRELAASGWNEKIQICHKIARKLLYGILHYMELYQEDPMIHRDLKPENVMASPDGSVVKIIDFDWVHMHASNVTITRKIAQKGTPGYADPRYWNSHIASPAMDIYSAGLVLYFLYTGHHHFYGTDEINHYMVGDDYAYTCKEMPGIDEDLHKIIARMIAREEDRYGTIREVIRDFEDYLTGKGSLPEIPELLDDRPGQDVIRFSYRVGDIRYSPYVKNYRFVPIEYGRKQERSQNGRLSAHIMSFYRTGSRMKAILLHEDCHPVSVLRPDRVSEGDTYSYAGTTIEVLRIRG